MKKNFMLIGIIAFIAIIGLAFFACKDDGGTTEQPKARMDNQPAQTLSFTGGTGTYSVTVKSADLYLDAAWTADVAKVIAAVERGYNKDMDAPVLNNVNKATFGNIFAESNGVVITLSNSAANNCKVEAGSFKALTIKTGSLDTVDLQPAVWVMQENLNGENNSYPKD